MDRANGASRAERFEDEKRRIIESCFSKKEPDGSLQETYITHIRVVEFSSHASTPPPPQARTADSEKPRIIIIAVRKSGRVRMHKSKENSNGTISIGKTWNLDELSQIESFTGSQCNPQYREWAGETGFVATLGKPYYWQAQTDKEKKFFIASMLKIYGKYTNGRVPQLVGFDQREQDQVMGAGKKPPPVQQQPLRPPMPDTAPSQQSNYSNASSSTLVASAPQRPPRGPAMRLPPAGGSSPAGSFDSTASKDRLGLRHVTQQNRSQESFGARSEDTSSLPPRSRNGLPPGPAFGRFGDGREPPMEPPLQPMPKTPSQPSSRPITPRETAPLPERRRPPIEPPQPQDRDLVPPPLKSPATSREPLHVASREPGIPLPRDPVVPPPREPVASPRDPVMPPPRSAERMSPRKTSGNQKPQPLFLTPKLEEQDDSPSPRSIATEFSKDDTKQSIPSRPYQSPSERGFASPLDASLSEKKTAPPTPEEVPREPEPPQAPPIPDEEARPGLGPMIKSKKSKGDIAGAFWKAASAANAFKPRPGGAGERLRQAAQKQIEAEGPDGITGVVPAPPKPASRPATPEPPKIPERKSARASNLPEVKITVPDPSRSRPSSSQGVIKEATKKSEDLTAAENKPRRSVVAGNDARYLQSLGVDPALLDSRSDEFGRWLDHFGWIPGEQMRTRNTDDMKIDLEREINKAQAGGWLARFQEEDERVDAIKRGIDLGMTECDELDNLLTLYSVELSTLSEDIAYIEAQGQGLQVQTANQKLLKKELESLLETCAITSFDLEALKIAPLENMRGLEDVESSLVTLFKAMSKLDPSLGGRDPKAADGILDSDQTFGLNSDYGQMRIVQEKKDMYFQESTYFMQRLSDFMEGQFDESLGETKRALDGALSKKADAGPHEQGRDVLWKYSPLMLYARDADLDNWNRLIQLYQDKGSPLYKGEFQSIIAVWRKNARKLTGEEADLLFTSQVEKQQESTVQTARKLTVKRSQTLARALRSPLADGEQKASKDKTGGDSRSFPYVVFSGVLDDLLPLVEMEQNFIVDFFHATTLEQLDFPDAVATTKPRDRRGGDLRRHRLMEPDRDLARRVTRSMEVIFSFLEVELQRLMEWVIGQDPLQGVGVLATLERKLADMSQSNQDYMNNTLQKVHAVLGGRFRKFVDEQIRGIEETKVKISKRKGVISFIRVFPAFSTAVENMLAGLDPTLAVRRTVDKEYDRILKSMFDSLKIIARENPAIGVGSGADPEDKEALNFHILLIENANHFVEETDTRGLDVLEDWKENANGEYHEHMGLYLNAIMRRPLGKLLDHLENIEAQLQTGKSPSAIAAQPSNSKNIFNKILGAYDSKEVRKGIDALRKRVEKHFGDADDPALSRGLVGKVMKDCESFYGDVESRIGRVTTDVYGGDVLFEWPRADVKAAFR